MQNMQVVLRVLILVIAIALIVVNVQFATAEGGDGCDEGPQIGTCKKSSPCTGRDRYCLYMGFCECWVIP
jgi:hypothetical protein